MSVQTSTHFISASASGESWRDVSKTVLEALQALQTEGFKPNIGFLYLTEDLAADASSILTLFRSVTGIDAWSGCAAMGVCASGREYIDVPAISVLIGQIPPDQFRPFMTQSPNFKQLHHDLEPWLNKHDPMLVVVHADPFVEAHPAQALEEIDTMVGGFMVGGMASSRKESVIIAREAMKSGISGFVFDIGVAVATTLSQGCVPMGEYREISKSDDHVVAYLDGKTPFEMFSQDMKSMAQRRLGYKPAEIILKGDFHTESDMPTGLMNLLNGEAHVAFAVSGTDQKDFLVRNIMAIDQETGAIAVSETVEDGQKMMFVYRDDETVKSDLSHTLVALQKRVTHDTGGFAPKAAIYVSCVSRARVPFGPAGKPGGEMALLKEILGDIPIAGFYANGEISNNRLYGYTGVVTLFL